MVVLAQGGRAPMHSGCAIRGNEVKVGARHARERPRNSYPLNQALVLLDRLAVPALLRMLVRRYQVSLRQARRYVDVARRHPGGVPVPDPPPAQR